MTEHLIARQKGLISKGFEDLDRKYNLYVGKWPDESLNEPSVMIDRSTSKSATGFEVLEYELLPVLSQRIESLCQKLEPTDSPGDDPLQKLELISELQVELDTTLYQITKFAVIIRPRPSATRAASDDNRLKDLKTFRAKEIYKNISNLMYNVSRIFKYHSQLKDNNFEFSLLNYLPGNLFMNKFNVRVKDHPVAVKQSINRIIISFTEDEFFMAQKDWKSAINAINTFIYTLTEHINPTTIDSHYNYEEEEKERVKDGFDEEDGYDEIDGYDEEDGPIEDDYDEGRSDSKRLSELAIRLARSALPIFKLSRLFLGKLMRIRTNEFQLESSTDMNSKQLDKLKGSDDYIFDQIIGIHESLIKVDRIIQTDTIEALTYRIDNLTEIFHFISNLLKIYVVPLLKDTVLSKENDDESQPDHHHHLKNWLPSWNNLFRLSTQNLIKAFHVYSSSTTHTRQR
ncbi:hypothetical protein MJO29_006518 [Puccinia striiformis f. sp. tritici]|uniref:Uncharacterized protein n=1 Tax=Puccinia striiformis TaxID=27350 RepID=A0A2S4VN38_9BASI|nr:hypothetical protein MJO29_006518 [Puccinia striiformis f. sp. tritici]POW10955.1 hypothetical protein PSTT_05603 [Puccinia striiformis]